MKYIARPKVFNRPDMHTVGRISHGELIERDPMPTPDRVEIERDPHTGGYFVIRYTRAGDFCGDTWHESLEDAFNQANFEYGLSAADFLVVHDGASGSAA